VARSTLLLFNWSSYFVVTMENHLVTLVNYLVTLVTNVDR
jgi:hypothetical protein